LLVVFFGIFAAIVFMIVIFYMKKTSEMDYKLWDLSTVTASDFTVELNVTKTMWETFKLQRAAHE